MIETDNSVRSDCGIYQRRDVFGQ